MATSDTRIPSSEAGTALRLLMKMGGYAAPRMAQALREKGGTLVASPAGFFVKGTKGPLKEGELERTADWAKQLLNSLA